MARAGVTYQEVVEAATKLVGQGKNPTVEQVRLVLGTGSSTTIANHLRQWRVNQEASVLTALKENIPAEMVAMLKGLWERLVNLSEAKLNVIQHDNQQTIAQLQQEVEKYKTNNQRWQNLFNQWRQEKAKLSNDLLTTQQEFEFANKEIVAFRATEEGLHRQLQEKQDRIEELNKLHQQTQSNLEHYRESAREQRMLDQQQFESQKQQLQNDIKNMREQWSIEKTKLLETNHQYQQKIQQLRNKVNEIQQEKEKYKNDSEHWQMQHAKLQIVHDEKSSTLFSFQSEVQFLNQQLKESNHAIALLENKIKLIEHEKWAIGQEKAILEGQLKQVKEVMY